MRLSYPPYHVLVAKVSGVAYAIEDSCAHAGASLAQGARQGDRVACPMHGYLFDLRSGKLVEPEGFCDDQRPFVVREDGEDYVVYDPVAITVR